jgi:hypothetical protein
VPGLEKARGREGALVLDGPGEGGLDGSGELLDEQHRQRCHGVCITLS